MNGFLKKGTHVAGVSVLVFLFAWTAVGVAQDAGGSKTYDANYAAVWTAVLRGINEGGDTVVNQDKESGTISTEWYVLKESSLIGRGWKVKENVLVSKVSDAQTRVTLNLAYQNKIGHAEWRPAPADNDYTPKINKAFFEYVEKNLQH